VPYATAAASFFAKPGAWGGGRRFLRLVREALARVRIDLAGVQHQAGATFRWACRYDDKMIERTTLKTEQGVFADFKPVLPEGIGARRSSCWATFSPSFRVTCSTRHPVRNLWRSTR
jgi:hypothetical protein